MFMDKNNDFHDFPVVSPLNSTIDGLRDWDLHHIILPRTLPAEVHQHGVTTQNHHVI